MNESDGRSLVDGLVLLIGFFWALSAGIFSRLGGGRLRGALLVAVAGHGQLTGAGFDVIGDCNDQINTSAMHIPRCYIDIV